MVDTIKGILATARKHKIHAGLHCGSTAYAKQAIGWGYQFVTILADNALLMNAAKQTVAEMRAGTPAASAPAKPTGPY
jgi:4-hydroxy-2-oxoheptanedioate aldolase